MFAPSTWELSERFEARGDIGVTYTGLIGLIERNNATAMGLRLWSLVSDHRIAEARVRPQPQGLELLVTIDGAPHWSQVFTADHVETLFETVSNWRRLSLMADGWREFGAHAASKRL